MWISSNILFFGTCHAFFYLDIEGTGRIDLALNLNVKKNTQTIKGICIIGVFVIIIFDYDRQ